MPAPKNSSESINGKIKRRRIEKTPPQGVFSIPSEKLTFIFLESTIVSA